MAEAANVDDDGVAAGDGEFAEGGAQAPCGLCVEGGEDEFCFLPGDGGEVVGEGHGLFLLGCFAAIYSRNESICSFNLFT